MIAVTTRAPTENTMQLAGTIDGTVTLDPLRPETSVSRTPNTMFAPFGALAAASWSVMNHPPAPLLSSPMKP